MAGVALTEEVVRSAFLDHSAKLAFVNHQFTALQDAVMSIQNIGSQSASREGGRGGHQQRYLVDLKHMSPWKYTGPRGTVPFRQ